MMATLFLSDINFPFKCITNVIFLVLGGSNYMNAPGMMFVSGRQSDLLSVVTGPFQFLSPSLASGRQGGFMERACNFGVRTWVCSSATFCPCGPYWQGLLKSFEI